MGCSRKHPLENPFSLALPCTPLVPSNDRAGHSTACGSSCTSFHAIPGFPLAGQQHSQGHGMPAAASGLELLRHHMESEGSTSTERATGWESRSRTPMCDWMQESGELGFKAMRWRVSAPLGWSAGSLLAGNLSIPFPGRNSQIWSDTRGNTTTASSTNPSH